MRIIKLTQNQETIVDEDLYDYLMRWKWCVRRHQTGSYYAVRNSRKGGIFAHRCTVRMHRVVLAYRKYGPGFNEEQYDSFEHCDHIFHDTLDNRSSELRECTSRENSCNRKNSGSSRYPGVRRRKNGWVVDMRPCGGLSKCYVGRFTDEDEAGRVAAALREFIVKNRIIDPELIKQWGRDHRYRR